EDQPLVHGKDMSRFGSFCGILMESSHSNLSHCCTPNPAGFVLEIHQNPLEKKKKSLQVAEGKVQGQK
ncbi:hypothetical protein NG726_41715, partial [Pseudomonas sp. MOB-449]|nr:hypothetical protein [Pseudomonas sp. MOB-449]